MKEINERIKTLRSSLNQSQESFGVSIGLSKSGISNIESGARSVTEKHIKLICSELNVNENWLRYGTGDMFIETNDSIINSFVSEYKLNAFEKTMLETYLTLTESQRNAITTYMQKLAKANLSTINNCTHNEEENVLALADLSQVETSATQDDWIEKELALYRVELEAAHKGKTSLVSEKRRIF